VHNDYEYKDGLCPHAEETLKHLICLPWDESWTKQSVEHAADIITKSVDKFRRKGTSPTIRTQKPKPAKSPSAAQSAKRIRIGIVGCGQMGRWHLDAYKSNPLVELVAFADTDLNRAQEFAKEIGTVAYSSHREMIELASLDGASICTVPSTHKDIAVDLLGAGINVLCEKPLAISGIQAKEMVDKASEKNLLLLPAFKFRFYDEVQKTKELLDKRGLGKILNFRLMFGGYLDAAGSWYSRKEISGGGVIIDNASHAIDLVRYLFGEVSSISAQVKTLQEIEVEDTAKLTLFMENGGFGTVDLSWNVSVPSRTYLEIYGEDGTALLDAEGVTYKFKTWNEWKRIPNQATIQEAFVRQTNHFVNSIANKKPAVLNNDDGLKSQLIIEAAYRSAKEEKKIEIG
jgi:predicted dehydrogenase